MREPCALICKSAGPVRRPAQALLRPLGGEGREEQPGPWELRLLAVMVTEMVTDGPEPCALEDRGGVDGDGGEAGRSPPPSGTLQEASPLVPVVSHQALAACTQGLRD